MRDVTDMNRFAEIQTETELALDAVKVEIDALCAQAQARIRQRYREALDELQERARRNAAGRP